MPVSEQESAEAPDVSTPKVLKSLKDGLRGLNRPCQVALVVGGQVEHLEGDATIGQGLQAVSKKEEGGGVGLVEAVDKVLRQVHHGPRQRGAEEGSHVEVVEQRLHGLGQQVLVGLLHEAGVIAAGLDEVLAPLGDIDNFGRGAGVGYFSDKLRQEWHTAQQPKSVLWQVRRQQG